MIDLSKLSPAPWCVCVVDNDDCLRAATADDRTYVGDAKGFPELLPKTDDEEGRASVAFAVMARNAFDGDTAALAWWEANRVKQPARHS